MILDPSSTSAIGPEPPDGQDELAKILDEYLLSLERGAPIAPADLIARHPDKAERLRAYLSGLALFHDAVAGPIPFAPPVASGHEPEPRELGDFRLVQEIGRGGMGVVYEAVQVSLGRRVAVKVLPFTAAINEKQITRFKNEAQAAAQIDHPNIVPVFAIGQEHGVHYFAMQLISGQSLSQLLSELRDEAGAVAPPTRIARGTTHSTDTSDHVKAVARMGVQAAEALHAAHEIGVVHRDIKPSNLLLDEKGKLWVTDFGVARCRTSTDLTETGFTVGTLPYMSPEQAGGQAALVDHRTDVYSLGVTLYELATFRHPSECSADADTASAIRRPDWRPPRAWNAAIPVDFENIVLKAIAERPEERYATARELAEDLNRFLDGRPILARRPSLTTRFARWAGRHQQSVAAAAVTVALVMVGLIVSLVLIASERKAKDTAYRIASANHARAEQNYAQAQTKFRQAREMLDRFGARVDQWLANDMPGAEGIRQELLAEMLPYYRQFASESSEDPSLQADLALTFSKIGYLSDQLGSLPEAERAYQDALAIYERLANCGSPASEHVRGLGLCLAELGQLPQKRGDLKTAHDQLLRAQKLQRRLVDQLPESIEYRTDLATTINSLGLLAAATGDNQQAAEKYRDAIEIQESIRRESPNDEKNLHNLAASYNNLSSLLMRSEPRAAQRWLEKAMSIQLQVVRNHPQQRSYQSDLALTFNNLGTVHSRLQQSADAERCFRDAITIQRRLVSIAPLVATYRRDLAVTYNNLGMSQTSARALADAEQSFHQAVEIQLDLVGDHPQDVNLLSGLGGIYNNLGMVHQKSNRLPDASMAFQRAIAVQQQAHERVPAAVRYRESLSKHYYNYAQVLRSLDRSGDAAAVTLKRRDLWQHHPVRLVRVAEELAAICQQMPPGKSRQRIIDETRNTLELATKSGLKVMPDISKSPFNVLSEHDDQNLVKSQPSATGTVGQ